jgi:hypothetical protein
MSSPPSSGSKDTTNKKQPGAGGNHSLRFIPEDKSFHNHCHENLQSYISEVHDEESGLNISAFLKSD